jgi:hypothetical protein
MVEPGLLKLLHHLGHCGHGAAQELMIFAKDSGVAFDGVRPNVRGHDTDELKRPIAAVGALPCRARSSRCFQFVSFAGRRVK